MQPIMVLLPPIPRTVQQRTKFAFGDRYYIVLCGSVVGLPSDTLDNREMGHAAGISFGKGGPCEQKEALTRCARRHVEDDNAANQEARREAFRVLRVDSLPPTNEPRVKRSLLAPRSSLLPASCGVVGHPQRFLATQVPSGDARKSAIGSHGLTLNNGKEQGDEHKPLDECSSETFLQPTLGTKRGTHQPIAFASLIVFECLACSHPEVGRFQCATRFRPTRVGLFTCIFPSRWVNPEEDFMRRCPGAPEPPRPSSAYIRGDRVHRGPVELGGCRAGRARKRRSQLTTSQRLKHKRAHTTRTLLPYRLVAAITTEYRPRPHTFPTSDPPSRCLRIDMAKATRC